MKPKINTATLLAFVVATILTIIPTAMAEEPLTANFRVDNKIFAVPQAEPCSQSITIFADGIVYDFMDNPKRIAIFDDTQGVFTLIDVDRGVQTVLTMQFVDKAIERLVALVSNHKNPQTQFLYNPEFDPIQKDATTGELLFKSPWIIYRVDAKAGDVKAAKQYHCFADAYAKLNTVLHPGSNPPFARMLVNKTLGTGTMLPQAVQVTYGKETDSNALKYQSKHHYEMDLNEDSKKRVEDAKKSIETLKVVTFEEYQK